MNNLNKFTINPTNEFHILRHFEFVEDEYKKSLMGKPYLYWDYSQEKYIDSDISHDDIEYALETIGTKFFKNISGLENPRKLLELIEEKFTELDSKNEIHWIDENKRKIASFSFGYNCSVGAMNCISAEKLDEECKKKIKSVPRSKCAGENNIAVNVVSGIELQPTIRIYVEIVKTEQLPFFAVTAFSDCSANNNLAGDDNVVFAV